MKGIGVLTCRVSFTGEDVVGGEASSITVNVNGVALRGLGWLAAYLSRGSIKVKS